MDSLPVSAIVVGERARRDLGNVAMLAGSLQRVGMLNPVLVNSRHELVAGRRRLEAARKLKWDTVPVRVVATFDETVAALRAELDENTCREPMAMADAVALGKRIEDLESPKAAARMKAGKRADQPSGKLPEGAKGDTRDKVAAALGVSGKTYEKAKTVCDAADREPARFGDLREQLEQPGAKVDRVFKEFKARQTGAVDAADVRARLLAVAAMLAGHDEYAPVADAVQEALRRLGTNTAA